MNNTEQIVKETIQHWREKLNGLNWYLCLESDVRRYFFHFPKSDVEKRVRWALYDLVADALEKGQVGLGKDEIKPLDYPFIYKILPIFNTPNTIKINITPVS